MITPEAKGVETFGRVWQEKCTGEELEQTQSILQKCLTLLTGDPPMQNNTLDTTGTVVERRAMLYASAREFHMKVHKGTCGAVMSDHDLGVMLVSWPIWIRYGTPSAELSRLTIEEICEKLRQALSTPMTTQEASSTPTITPEPVAAGSVAMAVDEGDL